MRIGITGASGFVGWHLRCRLGVRGHEVVPAARQTFDSDESLNEFVSGLDVLVHAAGSNRGDPTDPGSLANVRLATQLADAINRAGGQTKVIYVNSIHIDGSTEYGDAKRRAAEVLKARADKDGAVFVDLVLPHLFGEYGRPFYNSAVATFSHLAATRGTPTINPEGHVELLHLSAVADLVEHALTATESTQQRPAGRRMAMQDAWDELHRLHTRYVDDGTVPNVDDRGDLQMFNMLRSHLHLAGHYPVPIVRHADHRGAFSELCRADATGQTSISTSAPGIRRGEHFHLDKIERFVVLAGEAVIRLRRLHTDHVESFEVSGDEPVLIDMPPLVTHDITNIGATELITMFWAGDHFDPDRPDTYPEPVAKDSA